MTQTNTLIDEARRAALHARCPYSSFRVGAAVHCSDGSVVYGCNVENASYGLGMVAECVALFSAVAQGKSPTALAVSCIDAQNAAPLGSRMPCGACRQVLAEFCAPSCPVFIAARDHLDEVVCTTVGDLLPHSFSLEQE